MSLEVLAKEGQWTAYLDEESTGLVYYFNADTGESSWDPPTPTFPSVKVPRRKEAKMAAVQKEYNNKYTGDSNDNDSGGTFFTSLFSPKGESATAAKKEDNTASNNIEPVASAKDEEEPSLFKFFGGGNTKQKIEEETDELEAEIIDDATTAAATRIDTPSFFDNIFGQQKNGASDLAPKVEEVEDEEEVYDQLAFEDAVVTEEEPEIFTPIKLEIASKVMPHPEKVSWGGEDALFVSGKSFGVFDGVSGAEKLDGVPLYSATMAQKLKSSVGKQALTVEEIKAKMLKAAEYADMAATGATTAIMASVGDDDMLRSVNLGDSMLWVIRDGSIKSRAKETIHYFDCPFQLSDESPDRPRSGSVLQIQLQKGDIIIAGSDGVFDNLGDKSVLDIVDKNINGSVNKIAQQIASESRRVSKDTTAPTPYARAAKRNNYANYSTGLGGKIDDISCVVVRCK